MDAELEALEEMDKALEGQDRPNLAAEGTEDETEGAVEDAVEEVKGKVEGEEKSEAEGEAEEEAEEETDLKEPAEAVEPMATQEV